MNGTDQPLPEETTAERLARVEARLSRLEAYLQFDVGAASGPAPAARPGRPEDEFEFEVGQNWFAIVGIVVLVLGAAFTLSLPYAGLPAGLPSLIAYGAAGALFALGRRWRRAFELVAASLRGAAMALLYFASLRLCFFGAQHALSAAGAPGAALLVLTTALNLTLALRWRSSWLTGLALASGYATTLAVGNSWFLLAGLPILAAAAVAIGCRRGWPGYGLLGIALTYLTYLVWAVGDPLLGRPLAMVPGPTASLGCLLVCAGILATASWPRHPGQTEGAASNLAALFNCLAGYGLFLLHSLASFPAIFAVTQSAAALVFVALAASFWMRERSRVATFLYAMTGYLALTCAILKASEIPQVFIWLSLQSVLVVATAIWFQSRLIVVANFLIYAAIVVAYMALAQVETGISVAFGLVALGTARLLNWKRDRLELKTELMRNAYLVSGLVVFPYALYHLVPRAYVSLAWVGAALLYYGLNLVVRNQKYRWMGHATLLFTALYLLVVGVNRLEPLYRNLSFLVLGTVLLVISLIFTRLRARSRASLK
jgi:hypothetical protein